jgi:cyclopropane-fatty-acyl-phospholipid synthase
MTIASLVQGLLGSDPPVAVVAYDGTRLGPSDAPATVVVRSPDSLRRIVTGRGELGIARAYVAGDIDIEGDIFAALQLLRERLPEVSLSFAQKLQAARLVGLSGLRPLPPPPEEARLSGRRFTRRRSSDALAHHYDIPDEFFALFLGRTMAYTCAVFEDETDSLDQAQANKYELICRKLDLQPGMRLLDVGCGWGGMLVHSAERHGVHALGVSLSARQVEWARTAAVEAGVGDRVEVRQQDYRDIDDGPYDAISTMGVFEHVGLHGGNEFFTTLHRLLRPGGKLLNHAISQPPFCDGAPARNGFIQRYVFPDSELQEVGHTVSAIQEAGFEVRHLESLREHYALTLRHWVKNLEQNWDAATAVVGAGRARVWRLYMAAFGLNFVANDTQIHQILAVRPDDNGASGIPLRVSY